MSGTTRVSQYQKKQTAIKRLLLSCVVVGSISKFRQVFDHVTDAYEIKIGVRHVCVKCQLEESSSSKETIAKLQQRLENAEAIIDMKSENER